MKRSQVLVSWSSGKDSAWALQTLRQQPKQFDVRGMFTTVTEGVNRVSVHETPTWILKAQATRLGLPLYEILIPNPCQNVEYETCMRQFFVRARNLPPNQRAQFLAFGDLFLEDIRQYREDCLRGTGFTPLFPVWGRETADLADEMISSGLKAIVTAINPVALPIELAGQWFDHNFLANLPSDVDPLGENGEFHTCVVDGPMFSSPIGVRVGEIVVGHLRDSTRPRNPHQTYAYVKLLRTD